MTFTLTKKKLAGAILAVAMLVPATAYATHVFGDVPDGAFYAEPVEWAFNNGITTGKSPTSFAPLDNVTRGESVTFLKRYDDTIVQPALTTLTTGVATNAGSIEALMTPLALVHINHNGGSPVVTGSSGVSATYDAPNARYDLSVDGVTLSPTTHVIHVTPIRINQGAATEDRSAQTFFTGGGVQITVWDDSVAGPTGTNFHVSIYELPS